MNWPSYNVHMTNLVQRREVIYIQDPVFKRKKNGILAQKNKKIHFDLIVGE